MTKRTGDRKGKRSILDYTEETRRGGGRGGWGLGAARGGGGGKRACISGGRVSLTSQLFAAAHPFRRGLPSPRNLLRKKVGCAARTIARDPRKRGRVGESVRFHVLPAPALHTGRTDREFHTKHNLHIETQTQWPRQVGRGAVLPARARVRELHPRVDATYMCRGVRMERERERERERASEGKGRRDGRMHLCVCAYTYTRWNDVPMVLHKLDVRCCATRYIGRREEKGARG